MLTLPFKVCPTMLLEAVHCMPPISEGVASKVWPESVTLYFITLGAHAQLGYGSWVVSQFV